MYTVQWTAYPKKGDGDMAISQRPDFTIQSLNDFQSSAITELDEYCFFNDIEIVEGHFKVFHNGTIVKSDWQYYYFGFLTPDQVS